jgi:ELWxxDGT repeat protein
MDINTGADSSYPYGFTPLGDFLYFNADDATHGTELWRTNGTTTELVMDINTGTSGADGSDPSDFAALGDYLYFAATDATHGEELWRTNGTTTELVQDINTGTSGADSSNPSDFTPLGDFLYFRATDATHGRELWRTDGTVTERVPFPVAGQNISSCSCDEMSIVAVGGRLYTTVYSDAIGLEFAYLDEPTYVLPPTNRDGSLWTATLVILAGLTAAASIGLRLRGARRA